MIHSIPDIVRFAGHESAHATVCAHFGQIPSLVWIDEKRGGRCRGYSNDPIHQAIYFAAGIAGESLIDPWDRERRRRNLALAESWQNVERIAPPTQIDTAASAIAAMVCEDMASDVAADQTDGACVERIAGLFHADPSQFWLWCVRRARAIIQSHFDFWDGLTVELLMRGVVCADRIKELRGFLVPSSAREATAFLELHSSGEGIDQPLFIMNGTDNQSPGLALAQAMTDRHREAVTAQAATIEAERQADDSIEEMRAE